MTPPILPTTNIAPAPAPSSIESATPVESSANNFVTPDALNALLSMGFPENESKAALQAALGNPDLAYEYLLQGIPAQASNSQSFANVSANASTSIQQLRAHPQFNMLKQLIQSNPSSLPQVLNLIGQQNPSLLEAIHQNERDFLAMMNEPIGANSQPPAVSALPQSPGGQPNPAQIIQALSSLPESQRAQFAQSIGISPDQLGAFMQTLAQLPPGQLEQMMGSGGQPQAGQTTIALTHDEMEAINRLMSLGFSQQQAVQAFIACDRNETLAANFLFESGDDYDEGQEFEGMDGHEDDHN